jgi:hypothetical protein
MTDAFHRRRQRIRQPLASGPLAFEHVVRHALRGLLADARKDTEGFDELFEQGGRHAFMRLVAALSFRA